MTSSFERALAWLLGGREHHRRAYLDAGMEKMRSLGLTITEHFPRLEGRGTRGDVPVVVTKWLDRMLPFIVTMKDSAIPEGLVMARETFRSDGPDEDIGSRDFDNVVRMTAQRSAELSALLDGKMRAALLPFIAGGGRVEGQTVVRGFLAENLTTTALDEMAQIVRRLRLSLPDIPQRLLANARKERVPRVRLKTFAALWRHAPSSLSARDAVVLAREDPDGGVRLLARLFEAAEGPLLSPEETALLCRDEDTVLQAVRWMASMDMGAPRERVTRLLESLLRNGSFKVRVNTAEALGRMGHRAALKDIVALGEGAGVSETGVIIDALYWLADSAGEGYLLELLAQKDPGLIFKIARALGRVGTTASVEPLRRLAKGFLSGNLGRVAEKSIAQIQARLGPSERGGLSVYEGLNPGGQLSVGVDRGELGLFEPGEAKEDSHG